MKNNYEVPKLNNKQEVYDHVCRYIETIAKFQLAEAQEKGEMYIAFVGDDGIRSTLGCLFQAEKLKPKQNLSSISVGSTQAKVFKLIREAQGLAKKQKVHAGFLLMLEFAGESLYADKKEGKDWQIGRKDFVRNMKQIAKDAGLKPYKFAFKQK